ncbi:McnC domain containing protein [Nitzschia inconspicua]|uniref:McnC domain containing protein n=1 Tax=Nitzschia inconspicua TaxID=303405 RepID=A0A9K3KES9_9STRA|nr:McnC domain containing protein [Nitzschia inconspicua]
MGMSIDASGAVQQISKRRYGDQIIDSLLEEVEEDDDDDDDEEKKISWSSGAFHNNNNNNHVQSSSRDPPEQRPPSSNTIHHQHDDSFNDSISSMNSEDLVQRIRAVVGESSILDGHSSNQSLSLRRDHNDFVVDDTSFSSLEGINEMSTTSLLMAANAASDLTPNASFWLDLLLLSPDEHDDIPVLNLPKDPVVENKNNSVNRKQHNSPSSSSSSSSSQQIMDFDISKNLDDDILAAANKLQTTPMILYLCACEILLKRWTGEDDFIIGLTTRINASAETNDKSPNGDNITSKKSSSTSKSVSFASSSKHSFNTFPIRMKGALADRSVLDLIQRRDSFWKDAASHLECCPMSEYETTAEEIEARIFRGKRSTALFQVMLDYIDRRLATGTTNGNKSDREHNWVPGPCTEQHPLRVTIMENKSKIILQFSTGLWTTQLARTFLQNFETLLNSLLQSCNASQQESVTQLCSTIRILPDEQLEFLRQECYGTVEKWPEKPLMHQWFEQAADDNPNGIALKIMKQEMTYREVETRANKLARYLVDNLGVEVEDIVVILMPRGFDQIVALLAVLKAGAAYVPCDMTYPKARIETIMDDAGSFVCLTVPEGMETAGTRGVDIYKRKEIIESKDGSRLNTMVYLDNLAYVLYTSGSTGKPKGVEIEHNTVANYGNIIRKRFGIKESWKRRKVPDRILMTARISWDASLESLMLAFTNRSTLCLVPPEFEDTLVQNIELIATEMRVTRMSCAPGFSQWMNPSRLKNVQLMIFGGDVLPPTTAEIWQRENVTVLNSYGPTEATCCVTDNLGIENAFPGLASVPLGKPYENTVTLILDKNRQLCPPGVPGECFITGECLARGYRNLPELTNKAFVANPFDDPDKKEGETRMYKTGDLMSILPDGQLNFIGRIQSDSSYIKLRGYRIELGEIMAALDDHPIVTGSIAIPDTERQKLLAFVTVNGAGRKEAVQLLLDHCLDRLVDYMVPDRLIILENFPLDANGKIDRKILIRQSRGTQHSRRSLIQAESSTERKLTEIFAQSLGIPSTKISVHDNFFDLGGHSLLAAGAVSSIREAFDTDAFGVRDFFSARTIKEMASIIDGHLSPKQQEKRALTSKYIMRQSLFTCISSPRKTNPVMACFVKFTGILTVSVLIAGCFIPSLYLLNDLPWNESQNNAAYLIIMLEAAFFSFVGSLLVVSWVAMNILAHDIVHSRRLHPDSFDYLRWYIADQLWRFLGKKILLPVFGGTLWLSFIYRLFGAKIGRGVFIEDTFFRIPRLVVIGNFVVIQSDAVLENVCTLRNGVRVFGKVTIRDRVVVGCRSVLSMGCRIGKCSIVKSVSNVPRDCKVPPRSIILGTKIEPQSDADVEEGEKSCGILLSNMLWHVFSPLFIHLVGLFEFGGMICIAWGFLVYFPLYAAFVFLVSLYPIYLAIVKIIAAIIALLFRKIVCCGRMSPSEVILYSTGFYRYWAAAMAYHDVVSRVENTVISRVATKIMGGDVDLRSLYTSEPTDPELCVMGKNIFVANGVKLRNVDFSPSGIVRFGRIVIRDDCMLMDRAIISEGSILGKGVTIGVLTPTGRKTLRESSLYVGNPPFEKASASLSMKSKRNSIVNASITASSLRQMDNSIVSGIATSAVAHPVIKAEETVESVTMGRSIFEYLMIGYSSLLSLDVPLLGIIGGWLYVGAGTWNENFYIRVGTFVAASPVVGIIIVTWMMMAAILTKRVLVGDFSRFVQENEFLPETHLKVFRWRLTYLLVCDAKTFLQWVDNYDLTRIFWSWMGVKVGKRVMIHPEAYMYETDLLHLDDGVQVDEMATLFCHTFRTRHLELKPIYVGAGASVGINSVVLPGCHIGPHVELLPLTQVFPTERIKAGVWHGNPAEPVRFADDAV